MARVPRSNERWALHAVAGLCAWVLFGAMAGPGRAAAAAEEERPLVHSSDAVLFEESPRALHQNIASGRAAAGMDGADRAGACEPQWQPGLFAEADLDSEVFGLGVVDDGSGPALHVGGVFTTAGGQEVSGIVRYNGSAWTTMGSGLAEEFLPYAVCFAVFDDGSGPATFVGGNFDTAGGQPARNIARWDGSAWSPLGSGLTNPSSPTFEDVRALAVFDDGSGSALYAGGFFTTAGGQPTGCIARWDGSEWSPVGGGLSVGGVFALTVFDDGSGPALYAAGQFEITGQGATIHVARWDGSDWSPVGVATNGFVRALCAHDDGSGPALYAAGSFTVMDGQPADRIARWDGAVWSPVGSGFSNTPDSEPRVRTLVSFDDGSGSALYAGGFLTLDGERLRGVARWDGSAWSQAGSTIDPDFTFSSVGIDALAVFQPEGSSQATLYAGGQWLVDPNGPQAPWMMLLDGSEWRPVSGGTGSTGTGSGTLGAPRTMTVFDDGTGPALYAAGFFSTAGGRSAGRIARWSGAGWSPLGDGLNLSVAALGVFDDGSGPALYAGGNFTTAGGQPANRVARWDGTSWSPLGEGINSTVYALAVFDDGTGSALYAGGQFTTAGGQPANRIARWDGSTWSPLGTGLESAGIAASVRALTVFDDGTGPALYAAGLFDTAGGQPADSIARWDGSTWSPVGSGLDVGLVQAMTVFDDGSGPALHAGGQWGGVFRWDGADWSPVGNLGGEIFALAVFDDGSGPALYAGVLSATANLMRWNNTEWLPLATSNEGGGSIAGVTCLTVFDDGGPAGPALFAGGPFTSLATSQGEIRSKHIARFQGCPRSAPACPADIDDNGVVDLGDLLGVLASWGDCVGCPADLDGSGVVDLGDLLSVLAGWGPCV